MPLVSLSSFCRQHSLPKTSVHTYLTKTLKFNVSQGLSIQAQEAAIAKFSNRASAPSGETQVSLGQIPGNSALPALEGTVSLDQFRSAPLANGIANPGDFIEKMTQFLDQIEQGFDLAELAQESELSEARQQKQAGLKRLNAFRLRAAQYSLKTDLLSQLQGVETGELQGLAAELAAMSTPPPQAQAGEG